MSKDRAVRSSQNFKPTNKSKSKTSFKSREKPKYRSGTRPKNRSRDSGKAETIRSRSGSRPNYRPPKGSSSRYQDRNRRQSDRGQSDRRQSDRGPKELFPATCAKCKKETQVPFKPTGSKPVLCRDCFQDQKPRDGSSTGKRYSSRSSPRYDDRSRRTDGGSKQLFDATCAKCNKETQVPFKPTGSKPVLCRECFQQTKPQDETKSRRYSSRQSSSRYQDRSNRRTDGRSKQLYDATCAKCKKETQVTFKPTGIKPVLCKACFLDEKYDTKSSPAIENTQEVVEEEVERFGDRTGPYRANKRMHQTTCRTCGEEITVPFKPKADKEIYCQDCFQKVEQKE